MKAFKNNLIRAWTSGGKNHSRKKKDIDQFRKNWKSKYVNNALALKRHGRDEVKDNQFLKSNIGGTNRIKVESGGNNRKEKLKDNN